MTALVLGLGMARWVSLLAALVALLAMAESVVGHYRSGFPLRAQYAPLVSGGALVVACAVAAIAPQATWGLALLRAAGWVALATGAVGVGYHHYYGIAEKAGGYRWLLHYLMYGAPQLAPLSLSAAGALGVIAAHALAGPAVMGLDPRRALLGVTAVALIGAVVQTGILHYRGAFNTPLMYAPLALPPLAAAGAGWLAIAPGAEGTGVVRVLLWATFLTGFVGLGMHLRGLDRQMGGLHLPRVNLLQGPPALAPASYAAFAAVGLVALAGA
jgi:hypothetical protein